MTKKNKNGAAMPLIRMIDSEADALTELTLQNQRDSISFHELLLDEIDRAAICERTVIPPDVVTMGSNVTFIDEKSGAERTVRSEENKSEVQPIMRISCAVYCLKKKTQS